MKLNVYPILLFVLMVAVFIVIFNKIIRAMLGKYYVLKKLAPFIGKHEGGLSSDPVDNASSFPSPWLYKGLPAHTNRGVTYSTFVSMAGKLGYEVNRKNFMEMPDSIWARITSNGYWDLYPMDEISHLPRIQAVIFTWAWGSGGGGSEKLLANFQREVMGIKDSNITKQEIVSNFKKHINPANELKWFNKLCDRRAEDFSEMADYWKYKNGWLNRLSEFRKLMA